MITSQRRIKSAPPARVALTAPPLLENGDRLPAAEFLRRFKAMPEVKKAELINGVVLMPSPVRIKQHGKPDNLMQTWLGTFAAYTPGITAAANSTVRFDTDNVPQPDALLMIDPARGGNARIGSDGYLHGAPELVVEIAASSVAIDLHDKLDAYRRAGVREYVVWRTEEKACDWFVLEDDVYVPMIPDQDGVLTSRVFPGLSLDVNALISENAAALLARLSKTLNKAPHKAFVKKLSGRK